MKDIMESVDKFHIHYENTKIWEKSRFMGIPMWKLPFDAMVIQELIYQVKPDLIIETGTGHGGSALFYASICELLGEGQVISIDTDISKRESHKWGQFKWEDRIMFINGSSIEEHTFKIVKAFDKFSKRTMVLLDSWHTKEHVLKEIELYAPLVTIGSYLIVEDTHANGHPVPWEYDNEGPYEAVQEFLTDNDEFAIDTECEKYLMTFNPNGFLRRIR
jgi:cephalosporin hydroxylase